MLIKLTSIAFFFFLSFFVLRIFNRFKRSAFVTTQKLDKLVDELTYELIAEGLYQPFGPIPLLGYLFAKEKEVTNIRLILVGKDNQIDEQILRERMRPIYGS